MPPRSAAVKTESKQDPLQRLRLHIVNMRTEITARFSRDPGYMRLLVDTDGALSAVDAIIAARR